MTPMHVLVLREYNQLSLILCDRYMYLLYSVIIKTNNGFVVRGSVVNFCRSPLAALLHLSPHQVHCTVC